MYLTPIIFGLFQWIKLSDENNRKTEVIAGIGAGIAFIWFYKFLASTTPMAAVFATTAFGASETIGKSVFGALIPIIESVFFFVILPLWVWWKMGISFSSNLFSKENIITAIAFAAIFTIYHATSKGLTNNLDLAATFAFGVLSMFLIFYFRTALSAIIMHILVNGYSVKLFAIFTSGAILSSPYMILAIIAAIYLIRNKGEIKIPFLS